MNTRFVYLPFWQGHDVVNNCTGARIFVVSAAVQEHAGVDAFGNDNVCQFELHTTVYFCQFLLDFSHL